MQSASFYQIYRRTKFHNSGSYSSWETELNQKTWHKFVVSEARNIGHDLIILGDWASLYQMYKCTKFHNSGSYSSWETELNQKIWQIC